MCKAFATAGINKKTSSIICAAAYCISLGAAMGAAYALNIENAVISALWADIAAMVVVFVFSMAVNNSSMYDAYWSLAPIPISIYWAKNRIEGGWTPLQIIVIIMIAIWGARLTFNWYRQWKGLEHEDWRYIDLRNKTGGFYWLVSFFGIHFFPTIMVFLGCMPLYVILNSGKEAIGILDIALLIIITGAIILETVADNQLRNFVKAGPPRDAILSSGLWAYSRHPNYFGEVMFWWGIFLLSVSADEFHWWTIIGPVAITVMFLTVSIPMMEKRMLRRRPGYAERIKSVSIFVPWFPKKI